MISTPTIRHIAGGIAFALFTGLAAANPNTDALVTTDWLADNLDRDDLTVIEVSVNPGKFERGHIPGAVNFRWHTDLVDTVRRDIVDRASFQTLLRDAGVSGDDEIVLYGDTNNWFAAWGAWIFDIYGVDSVRLLDGGRDKWEAEGRPLSLRPASHPQGDIEVSEADESIRAFLPEVVEVASNEAANTQLVDIRSAAEYEGRIIAPDGVDELSVRAGHIPGAVNVGWGNAVNEDGTFKSADELRAIYAQAGVDGSKPVITYCRIGERSSHTWFALSKILGYDVKNYDGSWTEYGNSVGVPVTNLAGTVWGGQ
ncbi:thiosulfate sulfurtransferase [Spiribacter roseus]|uniref:sulfurtransferase n=1 Tax=Spiribacter roseus TaxID=1855875 RepID=UPI000F6B9221|nr:thiosulfate sulfurtransferase [Spiribacter roseus]